MWYAEPVVVVVVVVVVVITLSSNLLSKKARNKARLSSAGLTKDKNFKFGSFPA